MSNQIVAIPKVALPAAFATKFKAMVDDDSMSANVSGGFPVLSIRGSKWRIKEGGEEKPIYIPNTTDLAPSVNVVLLKGNPNMSKVFYASKFVEGSDSAPDCYSNDGKAPAGDSTAPQSTNCATCKHNAWGSRITEDGKKAKACADSRRIAILPTGDLDSKPILLRVPASSLNELANFDKQVRRQGVPLQAVSTKMSFDPDTGFPKILFKFDRVLTEDELSKVVEKYDDPTVDSILDEGGDYTSSTPDADPPSQPAEQAAAKTTTRRSKPAAVAPATEAPAEEKVTPITQAAPAPTQQEAAKAVVDEAVSDGALDDVDALLSSIGM